MKKTIIDVEPAVKLLLEEMKAAGWTSEAMEYIDRAVNAYQALEEVKTFARALLKALEPRMARTGASDTEQTAMKCLREAIAKAESEGQ
jgi:hypothetical protein